LIQIVWEQGWELWELVNFLRENGALRSGAFYRGQRDSSWGLVPALYRREVAIHGEISLEERYLLAENRMLVHFIDRGALLLPDYARNPVRDRIIAQHYGVPTQLLDWTLDPLVGIFFATQEGSVASSGAVYFIRPLREFIGTDSIAFPYIGPVVAIRPPFIDERVKMQKSIFTLQSFGGGERFIPLDSRELKYSGKNEATDQRDQVEFIGRIVIPADKKRQLRFQLLQLGVDSSLLFPGLQGIGERIAEYAELQNYGGSFLE
jgi:hypothetical protein